MAGQAPVSIFYIARHHGRARFVKPYDDLEQELAGFLRDIFSMPESSTNSRSGLRCFANTFSWSSHAIVHEVTDQMSFGALKPATGRRFKASQWVI